MHIDLRRGKNIERLPVELRTVTVERDKIALPGPAANNPARVRSSDRRAANDLHLVEPVDRFDVAVAERRKHRQIAEKFRREFMKLCFSVIADKILEISCGDLFTHLAVHRLEEVGDPVCLEADADRHRVAAVPIEPIGGMAEHFHEIQTRDAAARPVGDISLNGQDDGGAVVIACEA